MRKPCVDENGMKKGAWSEEEDDKLRSYILRYGHWNWRLLPKFAGKNQDFGLARCGKSCRLRWMNYLKPGLKRGGFTKEEEQLIAKLHDELGKKWSAMAARIPGRTDNEIKNFWHTHLKKRSKIIQAGGAQSPSSSQTSTVCENQEFSEIHEIFQTCSDELILESSGTLNSLNAGVVIWDSEGSASSSHSAREVDESILSEKQQVVNAENCDGRFNQQSLDERGMSSMSDGFEGSFWTEPFLVDTTSYSQDHIFSPLMEKEEAALYLFT